MNKELELWQFIADRLRRGEQAMLLVVAESSGSSPGRQGYKMAVGSDGKLCGSIGGGVMEVNLVEESRRTLLEPTELTIRVDTAIRDQTHRKDAANPSGMICSGKQTVLMRRESTRRDQNQIDRIIDALKNGGPARLRLSTHYQSVSGLENKFGFPRVRFERFSQSKFSYVEQLGYGNELTIIGGGHCALALSQIMSKMDFRISIYDDRPELNTIEKNRFAHEISIIDSYENLGNSIEFGNNTFVVVMTLGYKSDAIVIRQLVDREFKYFGVLGSKAKMATLMKELRAEGIAAERLDKIRTPIGLPINSHTPEEIAVSIAAEIIAVKNNSSEFKL